VPVEPIRREGRLWAGTTTRYSWGDDITPENANYGGNFEGTTEVGSFPQNSWGPYDTHGNVWEWVEDCWNRSYEGAPNGGRAWTSGDCSRRMLRGGSWEDDPEKLRSAIRGVMKTEVRSSGIGFRVARTLR
jgi:formylglycine-generating enzyme required for sulfatase activity